jgi:hypothetical protein
VEQQLSRLRISVSTIGLVFCGVALYASIPAPGGVINGCYKKSGGTLRIVDSGIESCNSNEIPVNWNQIGPQGAAGAPGAAGPSGPVGPQGSVGPQGPAGVIPAYFNRDDSLYFLNTTGIVNSLTVPAGTYLITGHETVYGSDDDRQDYRCTLSTGTGFTAGGIFHREQHSVAVQDMATFNAPTTITMHCVGYNVWADDGTLSAVKVW